ncbi:MAG: hypothetical protein ACYT04_72255, partial [Nostoc sp.]
MTKALVMSADALLKWKSQILNYQQKVRENKPPQQTALFDLTLKHTFWVGWLTYVLWRYFFFKLLPRGKS